ncbi:MAG: hypothetical protein DRP49_01355 [Spirochaetes bacterium]|nr:MAG: hypothetical protein DRP49_01355 [Spirochaetota bacterium]
MKTMPDCIVAAGGLSSRMKSWKPALSWGSETMLVKTVAEALSAGCRVIVAGGYRYEELSGLLDNLKSSGRLILHNSREWDKGMDETVRSALEEISSESFFVVPVDMPLITTEDYRKLTILAESCEDFAKDEGPVAFRPFYNGVPGHPVLLNRAAGKILESSPAGIPIRTVLEGVTVILESWEHEGVIQDIDTLSEYESLKP